MTGLAVRTPAGARVADLREAVRGGRSLLVRPDDARGELPMAGVAEASVDVRPLLRRRKDRKLLPRAAMLAIPAAHDLLREGEGEGVGLFLGVGREPPEDATEAAILASERDGQLDPARLGARGLSLYPPLASLRTLPNLVLAHVAIQLGLTGPGATLAGEAAAGLAAIVEGARAVAEGRCAVALAGGADSLVHPALARDAVRLGRSEGVGEAAALVRLEPAGAAGAIAEIVGGSTRIGVHPETSCTTWPAIGRCGAADGALAAVLVLAGAGVGSQGGSLAIAEAREGLATVSWRVIEEPHA